MCLFLFFRPGQNNKVVLYTSVAGVLTLSELFPSPCTSGCPRHHRSACSFTIHHCPGCLLLCCLSSSWYWFKVLATVSIQLLDSQLSFLVNRCHCKVPHPAYQSLRRRRENMAGLHLNPNKRRLTLAPSVHVYTNIETTDMFSGDRLVWVCPMKPPTSGGETVSRERGNVCHRHRDQIQMWPSWKTVWKNEILSLLCCFTFCVQR